MPKRTAHRRQPRHTWPVRAALAVLRPTRLLITLAALILLAALTLIIVAWIQFNTLAKTAVEQGTTRALGVPTLIHKAHFSPLACSFAIDGLLVANPSGFDQPHFLRLDHAQATVKPGSLVKNTMVLPRVTLSDLEIYLEKKGKHANYEHILDSLTALRSNTDPSTDSAHKFLIHEIVIQRIRVHTTLLPALGELSFVTIRIPELRLIAVGSDADQAMLMEQVSAKITQAVIETALRRGLGLIPEAVLTGLRLGIEGVLGLGRFTLHIIGHAAHAIGKAALPSDNPDNDADESPAHLEIKEPADVTGPTDAGP